MQAAMTGWFSQNVDYLVFLALVAALWSGLGYWLHRTGCLAAVLFQVTPK